MFYFFLKTWPVQSKKWRQCNLKPYEKKSQEGFRDHVETCQNLRNYICDICGFAVNHERQLQKHRQIHTEEGEQKRLLNELNRMAWAEARRKNPRCFSCDLCDRSYTTNQKLKFHKLSKHGTGPKLQCPYCPMLLINSRTLNVSHIRVNFI